MSEYDNYTGMSDDLKKRVDNGMGCGSYIIDGWADIINKLNEDIAKIDPDYKVDQIKEKFGGLRFYVTMSENVSDEDREKIFQLIEEAENTTMEICDVCGAPGVRGTQSRGYIATRCEEHGDPWWER